MALTAEKLKARQGKLTASRVGVLMSGDPGKIFDLWEELLGRREPPDLSGVWPVRLGEVTETLQLDWYERKTERKVTRRGEVVTGIYNWMAATLDGFDEQRGCVVECKHTGGREPLEVIIARYQPQLHWQMLCTHTSEAALSVIMGANEPIVEYIERDVIYECALIDRAVEFMACVESRVAPVRMPEIEPPPLPAKEYDMTEFEAWRSLAKRWQQANGAAIIARSCEKQIKDMVPQDAKKAFGHGIVVTRNRAGAMSLREMGQAAREMLTQDNPFNPFK